MDTASQGPGAVEEPDTALREKESKVRGSQNVGDEAAWAVTVGAAEPVGVIVGLPGWEDSSEQGKGCAGHCPALPMGWEGSPSGMPVRMRHIRPASSRRMPCTFFLPNHSSRKMQEIRAGSSTAPKASCVR